MNWTVLPFLLPLITGLAGLFLGRAAATRRTVMTVSSLLQLGLGVFLILETTQGRVFALVPGDWSPRLGIALAVDTLSAVMVSLAALVSLACQFFSFAESPLREEHPLRLTLMQFLVAGVQLAFTTADLFNLFVAFEIMLISSYALMTLEADDWEIKQAYPYVAINLVGSALFICGAGLAYGIFGSLGYVEITRRAAELGPTPAVKVLAVMLMVVFCVKAGVFPLHYWLPNSYPILPAPLAALYGGLLTKVGIYALIRVFGSVLPDEATGVHALLRGLGAVTMVAAALGALSRPFLRGILAFQVLSQAGLIVLAVGLRSPVALAAAILYVVHDVVVKASVFLLGGLLARLNGSDHLERMGHLWRRHPWIGVLFLLQALSLAGIPPLSGFWGKLAILNVAVKAGSPALAAAIVAGGILTLWSMVRVWNAAFWSEPAGVSVQPLDGRGRRMAGVVAGLAAVSLAIGLGAEGVARVARAAADQVAHPTAMAAAVNGFTGKDRAVPDKEHAP